jgi:hypothetical protein
MAKLIEKSQTEETQKVPESQSSPSALTNSFKFVSDAILSTAAKLETYLVSGTPPRADTAPVNLKAAKTAQEILNNDLAPYDFEKSKPSYITFMESLRRKDYLLKLDLLHLVGLLEEMVTKRNSIYPRLVNPDISLVQNVVLGLIKSLENQESLEHLQKVEAITLLVLKKTGTFAPEFEVKAIEAIELMISQMVYHDALHINQKKLLKIMLNKIMAYHRSKGDHLKDPHIYLDTGSHKVIERAYLVEKKA